MRKCIRCTKARHCKEHGTYKLVHRDSLHRCFWLNEHVLTHYRPSKLPPHICARRFARMFHSKFSAFHLTNETVNIWTHFAGFLYFSYCQKLPALGASRMDQIVFSLSLLASQLCMLFSALFHTFGCSSAKSRRQFLNLDVFGISAGLLGMYLAGIYTAFFCFKNYLYFLFVLLCIAAYVPSRREKLVREDRRVSALHFVYSALVLAGLLPTAHWISIHGGLESQHVQTWLPNMFIVYGLTGGAFFFYASLIPERLSPGTFDVFGSSHQWWHLLILIAMVLWHWAGIEKLEYHYNHAASCPSIAYLSNITSASTINN